jgi:hypothetical protein
MSVKSIFLKQIDNFINELCIIFPNSKDILLLSEKYSLIRNINSNLIIEYFVSYIYPHKNTINNEDESFFLNGGGQDEIKDKSGLKFRDNIKTLWINEMSEENKEIIWKYFKIFMLLSDKYIVENMKL